MNQIISPLTSLFLALVFTLVSYFANAACKYNKAFQAEELEIGIMLEWSTEMEENNEMFVIEKSSDGIEFTHVGTVDGSGTCQKGKKYNFLDVMARNERLFYRLKQIDFDGSYTYSKVQAIFQKHPNKFMVAKMSAIAATDQFEVTIDALKDGQLHYDLQDAHGISISNFTTAINNGLNLISVDISNHVPGIYKLKLQMETEVEVLTFKKIQTESIQKPQLATTIKIKN